MLIKKLVVLLLTIFISGNLLCAQSLPGEWQLTKVDTRVYTQDDHRLMEARTFTSDSSINMVNGLIPRIIRFETTDCLIMYKGINEAGTYKVENGEIVFRRNGDNEDVPGTTFSYVLAGTNAMKLLIPDAYYKDNKKNLAVIAESACYYTRKQ